ncbi:MAG: HAMP domain-containing histidine kinase [Myxococcales bacterium]|nr:HAMP domain-containing histidine kinase [Myxococcales bacterium]
MSERRIQSQDLTPPEPAAGGHEPRIRALEAERDELARALDEARDRQHAAEEALRARDELFAVIVHDLRNPLGTIVMGSTALLQGEPSTDPKVQRIRTVAERIHRQAERMTRQIGSLSDYNEIQAGRLAIDRGSHTPAAILAAAGELIGPVARERGIGFESHAEADLPAIECDVERVAQTLANLATTAIKVTSRGGVVEIGVRRGETPAVFYVRDHGDSQATRLGTGLMLTIARGVVAAHGGRLWNEQDPATGHTVWFSLSPT